MKRHSEPTMIFAWILAGIAFWGIVWLFSVALATPPETSNAASTASVSREVPHESANGATPLGRACGSRWACSVDTPKQDSAGGASPGTPSTLGGMRTASEEQPVTALPLTGNLGTAMISGDANYAAESYGPNYLAIRFDRGTRVRVCGEHCKVMVSTDYGPKRSTGDIADIGLVSFAKVCGYSLSEARQRGECRVTIEFIGDVVLPETDVEGP